MNGIELKELRINKGLTQTQLADLTGIPQGTIGRIESTGQDIKKVGMLNRFLEVFKNEENGPPANFTKLHSTTEPGEFYKALPESKKLKDGEEWKTLYFNQQEQIKLLAQQVEMLNQIVKK